MNVVQHKICLLGHFSVGKTSLIYRFIENQFSPEYHSTIGVHIAMKTVAHQGTDYKLYIWDLAGGERFEQVGPYYLNGASGALIVCDLTNQYSSEQTVIHAKQLQAANKDAKMVFVGNKVDLVDKLTVTPKQLHTLSQPFGGTSVLTSAKTGSNVEKAFSLLVSQL